MVVQNGYDDRFHWALLKLANDPSYENYIKVTELQDVKDLKARHGEYCRPCNGENLQLYSCEGCPLTSRIESVFDTSYRNYCSICQFLMHVPGGTASEEVWNKYAGVITLQIHLFFAWVEEHGRQRWRS